MVIPDLLREARERLRETTAAWSLLEAAVDMGDERAVRQYAFEAQYAADHFGQILEEWFVLGQLSELGEELSAVREARRVFELAVLAAKGETSF